MSLETATVTHLLHAVDLGKTYQGGPVEVEALRHLSWRWIPAPSW